MSRYYHIIIPFGNSGHLTWVRLHIQIFKNVILIKLTKNIHEINFTRLVIVMQLGYNLSSKCNPSLVIIQCHLSNPNLTL